MLRFKILVFGVIFISNLTVLASDKFKDSLLNKLKNTHHDTARILIYHDIAFELRKTNTDSSLAYAYVGYRLALKNGNNKLITQLANLISMSYRLKQNDDSALWYGLHALKIAQQENNKKLLAMVYNNLGAVYDRSENMQLSLKYFLLCLKVSEELGDKNYIAKVAGNAGNVFMTLEQYKEALELYNKALKLNTESGDSLGIASNCTNMGICYYQMNEYKLSFYYLNRAKAIHEKTENLYELANLCNLLGGTYLKFGNIPKAIELQNQALELQLKIDDKWGLIYSYKNIGEIYVAQKNSREGIVYYLKALEVAKQINDKDQLKELYIALAEQYEYIGDISKAYTFFKLHAKYKDSLISETTIKSINELQTKYQTEKKEKEIQILSKDKALQDSEIKRQNNLKQSLFGIIALVLITCFILFRGYRNKQKANTLLTEQKQEIQKQHDKIEAQRDEIILQKHLIEEKNKETTDSILYASRIQRALLTSEDYIEKNLDKEYAILYKPKDIVSGDFYWALQTHTGNEGDLPGLFYIATADCTGHGVPGAFMSMLNISFLNEAVIERGITNPALILNEVRKEVIKALNPDGSKEEQKDGMDCVLYTIDKQNMKLSFAAANNPLWLIRKDEHNKYQLLEFKADKMPVGKYNDNMPSFNLQTVDLLKGDIIYTFTDGYADQFGGLQGKKFKYKPLKDTLLSMAEIPLSEQRNKLNELFESWKSGYEQIDDVLLIGVRI